jgi:hypothetical protein
MAAAETIALGRAALINDIRFLFGMDRLTNSLILKVK